MKQGSVRMLTENDLEAVLELEERIWGPLDVERVPRDTLSAWAEKGILIGCFRDEQLLSYAYGERINFSPIPPYSEELLATLEEYKVVRHCPAGNALHGISIAGTGMGAATALLAWMLSYARSEGLHYFVSLARLSGLCRFRADNQEVLDCFDLPTTALLYAYQVVSRIDSALIGPPLQLMSLPEGFPAPTHNDPVLSRFVRTGKELWGVAETSFDDPGSLNYSALLVLPLR